MRLAIRVAALLVLATGCGSGHEDAVRQIGLDYGEAVAQQDWAAACELLAPSTRSELEQSSGKSCAEALPEEQPPAVRDDADVHVYGTQAQLDFPGETLFLSQYDGRWRIVAAVCTPRPERPYDCVVTGG